jgi:hypothetical protein
MTTIDNIMALADEYALAEKEDYLYGHGRASHDRDALRAAIEQALGSGEPVAWINEDQTIGPDYGKKHYSDKPYYSLNPLHYKHTPLYATPQPQQREWVGLTEQEAAECWSSSTVRTWQAIEAKLREKNGGGV